MSAAEASPVDAAALERANKDRRRRLLWLTLILLFGLPVYFIIVALIMAAVAAPYVGPDGALVTPIHPLVQLVIYIVLGMVWALPLKRLAMGVGKMSPAAPKPEA